MDRWTTKDANAWWDARPWVCGFNFIPSTAVNFIEMWHEDSFDLPTITRELQWAADIGFNAIRVNLHPLLWQHDRDGLLGRIDTLMDIAAQNAIKTVLCLFDDCGFGGFEPVYGPQPDPIEGVHNSRAVASPGRNIVMQADQHAHLKSYVVDIVRSFRNDRRVLFWDIYNEPGNKMQFSSEGFSRYPHDLEHSALALMENAFAWARSQYPVQPLTVAAWTTPLPGEHAHPYQSEVDRSALLHSDIITFHAYWRTDQVERFIDYLSVLDRPMLCTEWMARAVDSTITDQLPMFRERKVGCFQWGLVQGRTQTHLAWPQDLVRAHGGQTTGDLWFHDLLYPDGTPYDPQEIATIRALTQKPQDQTRKGA
jgi:hypothetical protein